MRNKYFILVFTFLCLIMSQNSYSQDWDWEDMGWNDDINDFISDYENQGGHIDYYNNAQDYANDVNNDNDYSNDWEYYEYVNPDYVGDTKRDNQGNIYYYDHTQGWRPVDNSDNSNTDIYNGLLDPYNYYNDNDDPFYPYNEDQYPPGDNNNNDSTPSGFPLGRKVWFFDWDGDRYYSAIIESAVSPGEGWILIPKGVDCDDNDPAITTQCRPNTCKGCTPVVNEVAFVDIPDNTAAYGYVDAQGNVFIKSENGTYKKPSQLNPDSAVDRKALNEFAASWARSLGGLNKNIFISITDGDQLASENPAFTRTPPGTLIFLNSKGGFSKHLDNINNLKSIIKHEIFHVDDHIWQKKNPNIKLKNPLEIHADVYIKAANDPTYNKNTTLDFRKENTGSFANYLLNMDKSPDATITRDVIRKKIEEFNKNGTDVKVLIADIYPQKGALKLIVEYDGKVTDYIKMKIVNK